MTSARKKITLAERFSLATGEPRKRRSKIWSHSTQLDPGSIVHIDRGAPPGTPKVKKSRILMK
jgi:hypothetical protein